MEIIINRCADGTFQITGRTTDIVMTQDAVEKHELADTVIELRADLLELAPEAEADASIQEPAEALPELLPPAEEEGSSAGD